MSPTKAEAREESQHIHVDIGQRQARMVVRFGYRCAGHWKRRPPDHDP
jgi:hypothetical protein